MLLFNGLVENFSYFNCFFKKKKYVLQSCNKANFFMSVWIFIAKNIETIKYIAISNKEELSKYLQCSTIKIQKQLFCINGFSYQCCKSFDALLMRENWKEILIILSPNEVFSIFSDHYTSDRLVKTCFEQISWLSL